MQDDQTEKVLGAANAMEEKTIEAVDNLEKSKLGEMIPLEIVSLPLYDMTKYLMFFIIFDSIPIYLISCEKDQNAVLGFITKLRNYSFIFITIFSAIMNFVTFYGKMLSLYKFVLPVAVIKTLIGVIVVITASMYSFRTVLLALIYAFRIVTLDSLFLYYLVILLRRIESDEYDNHGTKLKLEKEGETNGEKV